VRSVGTKARVIWHILTEPATKSAAPKARRDARLLLTILVVAFALVIAIMAVNALRSLGHNSPEQQHLLTVVFPRILLGIGPIIILCYLFGRLGHPRFAARMFVAFVSAVSFYTILSSEDIGALIMPLAAVVLSSVLLTPFDTAGTYFLTVVAYLIVPYLDPNIKPWLVYGTLVPVSTISALVMTAVVIRGNDVNTIEKQSREIARNHDELIDARKMEAVARLSAGLAHEFNNIHTAILAYAQILSEDPKETTSHYGRQIVKGTRRAARMTDNLLAFSEQQLMRAADVDIDQLLRSQEENLRSILKKSSFLSLHLRPEAKQIHIDTALFHRAICTMLKKAEEHLQAEGMISIETRTQTLDSANKFLLPPGKYCVISIEDDGPTADVNVTNRLFDPFFTTGEFGSGDLELSAAYGIVRQSRGQVRIEGSRQQGNSILIALPLV